MRPISYEVDGFPEFIRSEEGARKVIARGLLTPDTLVIAYGDNGERERMRAADHSVLGALFNPVLDAVPPADETAPPAPHPSPWGAPEPPQPTPASAPSPVANRYATAAEPQPEPCLAWDDAPAAKHSKPWLVPVLVLAGVGGLVWAAASMKDEDTAAVATETVEPAATASEELPVEDIVTMYAAKPLPLRLQPQDDAGQVTVVTRGAELVGVLVPSPGGSTQQQWLRITQGPFIGAFAALSELSPDERPVLDIDQAGTWYLTEDLVPVESPEQTAPTKSDSAWHLTAGQQVDVVGVTGKGPFFSGWAEVVLPDQPGTAYVPVDRMTRTIPDGMEMGELQDDAGATDTASASTFTLRLQSKCSRSMGVLLRYRTPSGIQISAVDLKPRQEGTLLTDSSRTQLLDDTIYFTYYMFNDEPIEETDGTVEASYNGRTYKLRLLQVTKQEGQIFAPFPCDE